MKSDARRVLNQVETHAAAMKLRGARKAVLAAVLVLLPGRYSRVTDDAVRLQQLADLIVEAGGRRYCDKTIGRALAALADDELIVYTAARGRGNRALVAIHSRFVEGVEVLRRDETGRVIVPETITFSHPHTSYRPKANYPPTPQTTADSASGDSRPAGVEILPSEVREVLAALPAPYQDLPTRTRWRLGGLIRRQLGRGWLPIQITEILSAPMPAAVKSPLHLAMWRLAKNQSGSGPRLAPLQHAWDRRAQAAKTATSADTAGRWLAEVTEVTTADERERLIRAATVKFGSPHNPVAAIAASARSAVREYPGLALGPALQSWTKTLIGDSDDRLPGTAFYEAEADIETLMAIACVIGRCVECRCTSVRIRNDLPIPIPVCDDCWAAETDDVSMPEVTA